jgi:Tfp pilus assembly protein PilF
MNTSLPRSLAIFLAAFFLSSAVFAQVGVRIYGQVTDASGKPIEGARVEVTTWEVDNEQTMRVETDKKGRYRTVMMHNSRSYRFIVTKEGYETLEFYDEGGLKRTNFNAPVKNDFQLKPGSADALGTGGIPELSGKAASDTYNRGVKALKSGDTAGARAAFEQAVQESPDFALAQAALSSVLFDLEDYAGATRHARRAAEIEGDVRSFDLLLQAAVEAEDGEAVEIALEGLAKKRPDKETSRLLYNDGVGHFKADRLEKAEERFRKALEIDDSLREARRALAKILVQQGEYQAAKEQAQILVDIDRYDLEALSVLQEAREGLSREGGMEEEEEEEGGAGTD